MAGVTPLPCGLAGRGGCWLLVLGLLPHIPSCHSQVGFGDAREERAKSLMIP